jgi:hypothetical protein
MKLIDALDSQVAEHDSLCFINATVMLFMVAAHETSTVGGAAGAGAAAEAGAELFLQRLLAAPCDSAVGEFQTPRNEFQLTAKQWKSRSYFSWNFHEKLRQMIDK